MNDPIKSVKQQAYDLKKAGAPGSLCQLQELVARQRGFQTFAALKAALKSGTVLVIDRDGSSHLHDLGGRGAALVGEITRNVLKITRGTP